MLHKSTFEKVSFDTLLYGYGYEMLYSPLEAVKAEYKIKHIENPVIHAGLSGGCFLKKIEKKASTTSIASRIFVKKRHSFRLKSKLMLAYKVLNFQLNNYLELGSSEIQTFGEFNCWEKILT